jgi:hypothetical protein
MFALLARLAHTCNLAGAWCGGQRARVGAEGAGLVSGGLYRWRARVLYAAFHVTEVGVTPPPNPAHGPW